MSRRRRSSSGDEGGNWMDTYGDMVTLLLTFFVMLYSMSSLNQQKWEIFVKSIIPNAGTSQEEQVAINQEVDAGKYEVTGSMDTDAKQPEGVDMNTLYLALAQELEKAGVSGATVSRGEGYTFVSFEGRALFDGDSSVLTDQARTILDVFCRVIAPAAEQIGQIDIMGHTSQGRPDHPNNPRTDRLLSSMRSAEVAAYIQEKNIIEPDKLVGISYGQFRPVDTFETREGRANNRRVEMLILDEGADVRSLNEYYEEYESGVNADTTIVTQENAEAFSETGESPEVAASILPEESGSEAAASVPAEGAAGDAGE